MSEIKTTKVKLPVYIASYLINNDDSGITKKERQDTDDFIENLMQDLNAGFIDCVDVGDSHFSWYNILNSFGGDVAEYTFIYR